MGKALLLKLSEANICVLKTARSCFLSLLGRIPHGEIIHGHSPNWSSASPRIYYWYPIDQNFSVVTLSTTWPRNFQVFRSQFLGFLATSEHVKLPIIQMPHRFPVGLPIYNKIKAHGSALIVSTCCLSGNKSIDVSPAQNTGFETNE